MRTIRRLVYVSPHRCQGDSPSLTSGWLKPRVTVKKRDTSSNGVGIRPERRFLGGGGVVRNGVRHCWAQVYFTDGRSCRVGYRAEIRSSSMRGASQIHLLRWSSPTVRPLRSLVVETPLRLLYRHKDKYTRVCTCAYIMIIVFAIRSVWMWIQVAIQDLSLFSKTARKPG